jgi:predicted DNA-binding protein
MNVMATAQKAKMVRRSITVPAEVDSRIESLAKRENRSRNQVYHLVIEKGLDTKEAEKRRFFELADRLQTAKHPDEIKRLTEELARLTFGS